MRRDHGVFQLIFKASISATLIEAVLQLSVMASPLSSGS
jgi:hypothetical protein